MFSLFFVSVVLDFIPVGEEDTRSLFTNNSYIHIIGYTFL